ncbi:MAG: hypothetical protein F9K16_11410 [Thermoanaerobaculia bacterium]|nr:MAG: hypothetical protein F9K16_11410 [Thermoanaerobaculia bacterium]
MFDREAGGRSPQLRPRAATAALLVAFALASPAAAGEGLPKGERLKQLIPRFLDAGRDAALAARRAAVDWRDPRAVEAWLAGAPLSPRDELEIDMFLRRYELAVPRRVEEWHLRWLALHPAEGRRLHGDAAVERALARAALVVGVVPASEAPDATEVGTNRNLAGIDTPEPLEYQGEIQVAADPRDPRRLVAAANTWDDMGGTCGDFGMQAVFWSADGGVTWQYGCVPAEGAYGLSCSGVGTFGSDPAVSWDDQGNVFVEYMMLCAHSSTDIRFAIVVAKSSNGGATWAAQGVVKSSWATGDLEDKNFYAIDTFPTSPFHGRHYTCWDRNNNEKFAYSTNGGATWTEVDLPAPASYGSHDLGCDIAVADDGTVHVAWDRYLCPSTSCTDQRMYYTRSTNGGQTWSTPVPVHNYLLTGFSGNEFPPAQNERGISLFGSIAVDNSGGPCRGTLYVTYTDVATAGASAVTANVYVRRSTNGGGSWFAGVRVNNDTTTANTQFHSFLVTDRATGEPVVAWHDTRSDSAGDERVDFFVASSTNCGQSFPVNTKVSAASAEFRNTAISFTNLNSGATQNPNANPNQYGEYLGLDVHGGRAFVAWTDSRQFHPSFQAEPQVENIGFVEVRFDAVFRDGFETGDARIWSTLAP